MRPHGHAARVAAHSAEALVCGSPDPVGSPPTTTSAALPRGGVQTSVSAAQNLASKTGPLTHEVKIRIIGYQARYRLQTVVERPNH